MKLAFLILAAAINPVLAGGLTQAAQAKPFQLWSVPSSASTQPRGGMVPGDYGLNWNWSPWTATNAPVLSFKSDEAPADGKPWSPLPRQKLKPGVYRTSPYTLLVLVPGTQPGDLSILKSGTAEPEKMPVIHGGLKFTPYSFAEK
jgi:hypothetical protein